MSERWNEERVLGYQDGWRAATAAARAALNRRASDDEAKGWRHQAEVIRELADDVVRELDVMPATPAADGQDGDGRAALFGGTGG